MRLVTFESGIADPGDVVMLLQPLSQLQSVGRMSFSSEAQGFQSQQELLGGKRVQRGAQIPKNLHADSDCKRDRAECIPKLETMISFGRVVELGKPLGMLSPVKFAAVDDNAANGGPVSTDPFGGRVHDDIRAVVERSAEITSGAKRIVDLCII